MPHGCSNRSEEPNLSTGTPWSSWDNGDIRWGLDHNRSIEETADFRAQHDEETIFRARETDVAKCIIVEVERYTPPTGARAPAEPVQCSSDEVSHFRTHEVGRRATAIPSG